MQVIPNAKVPPFVILTRSATSCYKVDVTGDGIGFDQQYADRVFQLIQRLNGRSEYSGTGIGLGHLLLLSLPVARDQVKLYTMRKGI